MVTQVLPATVPGAVVECHCWRYVL